jgi:hypothetical protein
MSLWVVGWSQRVLEFHSSIFHRVKVSKVGMVCINRCFHSIQQVVLDAVLEPKRLEVLSQRCNIILLEVRVFVVLLNVKINILVEVEVLAEIVNWSGNWAQKARHSRGSQGLPQAGGG